MFKLITALIQWALFLGVTGGLVDVTIAMRREAAHAHQVGLISLSRLNHALVDPQKDSRIRPRGH